MKGAGSGDPPCRASFMLLTQDVSMFSKCDKILGMKKKKIFCCSLPISKSTKMISFKNRDLKKHSNAKNPVEN